MPLPKMPERMPINLIGNDVTYTRDCIKWAGGFNQCLDIAEKRNIAIVKALKGIIALAGDTTNMGRLTGIKLVQVSFVEDLLQELQPEQSPNEEIAKELNQ